MRVRQRYRLCCSVLMSPYNLALSSEWFPQAERMVAARRVPAEPAASAAGGDVARIRVRLPPPHASCLERRFNANDTLAVRITDCHTLRAGHPLWAYKLQL